MGNRSASSAESGHADQFRAASAAPSDGLGAMTLAQLEPHAARNGMVLVDGAEWAKVCATLAALIAEGTDYERFLAEL